MTEDGRAADASASGGESRPDRPGGKAALVEALAVRKNARRGFAFGFLFTLAVFAFFVLIPGVTRSPAYYVALAFVLATGIGGLATAALTVVTAYRLTKTL
ncbi:DUF7536 family protein [Halorientalis halophila]|uniref:DUF7536 family protein n=1 Tax=Halorientalis halophila TaxID=3108499 RepID=UPI0030097064